MARVTVLGPVEMLDPAGSPVTLAPRTRRLLAALSVRAGSVASVDWLAEALWLGEVPAHPENAVQTLVSRLRRAVRDAGGGPEILTRPEGYALVVESAGLDAADFRDLLARSRASPAPDDRLPLLTDALRLWRGPAYGLLADEPFARAEAAALTEQRSEAIADLAEAELDGGQPSAAQERLAALITDRPYDERPVLLLMRSLSSTGRTAEALAAYADLRRRLREDLGLEPSPGAVEAQRELLRPRPDIRAVGLPPAALEVIGRARDERALAAALAGARLVTVLGPGGLGKTTLAYRVAGRLLDAYADGVVVTELGRLEPGDDVAAAICTVLRIPTGRTGPRRQLFQRLRDRHLLLLLDNCEHLVADLADLLDRLLAECPGVTVLATSRVALRIPGEHALRLEPLPTAAAVELFRRRARLRLPDFAATDDVMAAVAELCARLDGLPLAIELAASRVDVITPVELLERWSWHRSVLRGGPAGDPRHRSLTALVDWSYERLPADAQPVFEAVSVFAGEFTIGDVADLLDVLELLGRHADPGATLATLVDSSMLTRSAATGRLRLLETLRAYGRDRLAARPDGNAVARAHAELFADRSVAGRDALYGAGHLSEVGRLLAAVDELRAAAGWALDHDPALAARIAGGSVLLVEHALLGEAVEWADAVLARNDLPRDRWVCAVAAAGARFSGDLDRAATLADEALAFAGEDVRCAAFALFVRGEAALFAGDLGRVGACADRVARLARLHPEVVSTAQMMVLTELLARRYGGESVSPAEAVAVRLAAARNGRSVVAAWATYLEGELLLADDPGLAYEPLRGALELGRAMAEEYLTGVALVSVASAAQRSGRLAEARRLFSDVIRHWRVRGDLTHQWTTLRNVVRLLVALGQAAEALVLGSALLVPERSAAGFGQDAKELRTTVERLAVALGTSRAADAAARGAGLRDDQVVEFAARALSPPP